MGIQSIDDGISAGSLVSIAVAVSCLAATWAAQRAVCWVSSGRYHQVPSPEEERKERLCTKSSNSQVSQAILLLHF